MSVASFGQGIAQAFAQYLGQQRQQTRQQEDASIDEQMSLIKALSDRPDFNPALLGKAIHDLTELSAAKAGKRKRSGGMAGFTGSSELPISQLLQGMSDTMNPLVGRTTEMVPHAEGPAGLDTSSLSHAVGLPPAPPVMPSIAMRSQPVANQPMFRSSDEMAEEQGRTAGIKASATADAQKQADIRMMREAGLSDDEIKAAILRKYAGASRDQFQTYNFLMPDGSTITAVQNKATDRWDTPDGLRPQGRLIGSGPQNQLNFQTDDAGNVSGIAVNRNMPSQVSTIPVPPSVRGRTSPDGPVVVIASPDGTPTPVRMPRQGVTPGQVTNPAGGGAAVAAPSASERTAQMANLSALQALGHISDLYKDEYVGPAAGRINAAKQVIPGIDADADFAQFQSYVSQFTNTMIKAITGAQMSEPEARRLKGQLPQITDKPVVFRARLEASKTAIGDIARAYMAKGMPIPQELQDAAASMNVQIPTPPAQRGRGAGPVGQTPNAPAPAAGRKKYTIISVD